MPKISRIDRCVVCDKWESFLLKTQLALLAQQSKNNSLDVITLSARVNTDLKKVIGTKSSGNEFIQPIDAYGVTLFLEDAFLISTRRPDSYRYDSAYPLNCVNPNLLQRDVEGKIAYNCLMALVEDLVKIEGFNFYKEGSKSQGIRPIFRRNDFLQIRLLNPFSIREYEPVLS